MEISKRRLHFIQITLNESEPNWRRGDAYFSWFTPEAQKQLFLDTQNYTLEEYEKLSDENWESYPSIEIAIPQWITECNAWYKHYLKTAWEGRMFKNSLGNEFTPEAWGFYKEGNGLTCYSTGNHIYSIGDFVESGQAQACGFESSKGFVPYTDEELSFLLKKSNEEYKKRNGFYPGEARHQNWLERFLNFIL